MRDQAFPYLFTNDLIAKSYKCYYYYVSSSSSFQTNVTIIIYHNKVMAIKNPFKGVPRLLYYFKSINTIEL